MGKHIDNIRNDPHGLDEKSAEDIKSDFMMKSGILLLSHYVDATEYHPKISLLESELTAALASATSRFKLKHENIMERILARVFGSLLVILNGLKFFLPRNSKYSKKMLNRSTS